jgi:hypothetical protein
VVLRAVRERMDLPVLEVLRGTMVFEDRRAMEDRRAKMEWTGLWAGEVLAGKMEILVMMVF